MPRPSEKAKAAFSRLVPEDPAVVLRPMFGNLAAFVNGNMFAGLFGEDLFVRLPEAERAEVKRKGGRDFEPMAGRAMTGYVVVPGGWQRASGPAQRLIERALGVGTVDFDTAGSAAFDFSFVGVAEPRRLVRTVDRALRARLEQAGRPAS